MKLAMFAAAAALTVCGASAGAQAAKKDPDQQFVMKAAMGGMAEVETGQLAAQNGMSNDVKQFGQMMVTDHTKANDQLKQIASNKGINIPTKDPKANAENKKLTGLSGVAFDKAYVQMEVKDHGQTIALFKKEASSGADPDLKQFASDTLPTLQQHMDKAKQLASSMAGTSTGAVGAAQ